jgi:hypothetical protein
MQSVIRREATRAVISRGGNRNDAQEAGLMGSILFVPGDSPRGAA